MNENTQTENKLEALQKKIDEAKTRFSIRENVSVPLGLLELSVYLYEEGFKEAAEAEKATGLVNHVVAKNFETYSKMTDQQKFEHILTIALKMQVDDGIMMTAQRIQSEKPSNLIVP